MRGRGRVCGRAHRPTQLVQICGPEPSGSGPRAVYRRLTSDTCPHRNALRNNVTIATPADDYNRLHAAPSLPYAEGTRRRCPISRETIMYVQPYVFFNGRCEEALKYYCEKLGAEITFQMRYKDAPPDAQAG